MVILALFEALIGIWWWLRRVSKPLAVTGHSDQGTSQSSANLLLRLLGAVGLTSLVVSMAMYADASLLHVVLLVVCLAGAVAWFVRVRQPDIWHRDHIEPFLAIVGTLAALIASCAK